MISWITAHMDDISGRKVINLAERKMQRLAMINVAPQSTAPKAADEADLPDFISPPDISKMTDPQLEQMLNLIRVRRLQSAMIYEQTKAQKAAVAEGRALDMLEKKAEQVFKELERAFNVLDKLELRVNEMRALRVQAGLDF